MKAAGQDDDSEAGGENLLLSGIWMLLLCLTAVVTHRTHPLKTTNESR